MKDTNKYRPVLTASQISHIISLCKNDASSQSLLVISVLASFEYKIQNASINPSYRLVPKPSLAEQAGLEDIEIPKYNKPLEAYNKYILHPSECSVTEISLAKQYMYLNDLMNETEELEYANSLVSKA